MTSAFPSAITSLNDRQWLDTLINSIDNPVIAGVEFPGFPPEELQATFVGSSNKTALQEAYHFYHFLKVRSAMADNPVSDQSRFLDFGCGWGRFLRFFWKDIEEANLYGCDTNKMILETCQSLNVPGQLDKIEPRGQLPYADGFFDHAMAYSVFTHLPEAIHLHWMKELARVTRPGSIICLTLEPRRFIDFVSEVPQDADNAWYRKLSVHKPNVPQYHRDFDDGRMVFMPTNAGHEEIYGDAVVPLSFIENHWQPWFDIETYLDDPEQFWQAVLVVKRTAATF